MLTINSREQLLKVIVRIVHHKCYYCGRPSQHADHITPRVLGGESTSLNLIGACATCNCRKGGYALEKTIEARAKEDAYINEPMVFELFRALNSTSQFKKPKDPYRFLEWRFIYAPDIETLFSLPGFYQVAHNGGLTRHQMEVLWLSSFVFIRRNDSDYKAMKAHDFLGNVLGNNFLILPSDFVLSIKSIVSQAN